MQRNELWLYAMTQTRLRDKLVLSKINQIQKSYLFYNSIYMKLQNRQNLSMMIEVRIVVTFRCQRHGRNMGGTNKVWLGILFLIQKTLHGTIHFMKISQKVDTHAFCTLYGCYQKKKKKITCRFFQSPFLDCGTLFAPEMRSLSKKISHVFRHACKNMLPV